MVSDSDGGMGEEDKSDEDSVVESEFEVGAVVEVFQELGTHGKQSLAFVLPFLRYCIGGLRCMSFVAQLKC